MSRLPTPSDLLIGPAIWYVADKCDCSDEDASLTLFQGLLASDLIAIGRYFELDSDGIWRGGQIIEIGPEFWHGYTPELLLSGDRRWSEFPDNEITVVGDRCFDNPTISLVQLDDWLSTRAERVHDRRVGGRPPVYPWDVLLFLLGRYVDRTGSPATLVDMVRRLHEICRSENLPEPDEDTCRPKLRPLFALTQRSKPLLVGPSE